MFSINSLSVLNCLRLLDSKIPRNPYIIVCRNSNYADTIARMFEGKTIGTNYVEANLSKKEYNILLNNNCVETIENNHSVEASSNTESEPSIYVQPQDEHMEWNIKAITASEAHNLGYFGSGVNVAVLDSGIDSWSLDESGVDGGVDFVHECEGSSLPYDDLNGHGTSVASIIGAPINGYGIIGVAPKCNLYAVKVLDKDLKSPISRIIEGLDWCVNNNIDVVNLSFGTFEYSYALEKKIQELIAKNIVVVAAAGNTNDQNKGMSYPAKYSGVLSVGSVDNKYSRAKSSAVDENLCMSAPGENIKSIGLFGCSSVSIGTSMAAPHITGAVALLKSKCKSLSSDFIKNLLEISAKNIGSKEEYGSGIVDIGFAFEIFDDLYKEDATFDKGKTLINKNVLLKKDNNDIVVTGMWGGDGHNKIINDGILVGATTSDIQYIKVISAYMDSDYSNYKQFHGSWNYVKMLKYLFDLADGYSNSFAFNHTNWNPAYYNNNNTGPYNNSSEDYEKYTQAKSVITSIMISKGAITQQQKKLVVLGIMAHLIGDIYAHRTIVPYSAVQGTNPSTHNGTQFGSSDFLYSTVPAYHNLSGATKDIHLMHIAYLINNSNQNSLNCCRCWNCFQRTAELAILQFFKIKYYSTNSDSGAWYEDYYGTGYFYARRLRAASYVLWQLYAMIYYDDQDFSTYFLIPGIYGDEAQYQLKVDLLWKYSYNVQKNNTYQDSWIGTSSYYVYSTFLCNKSSCSVSSSPHYVVDDVYYQEDMPFLTDRFPVNCKMAFEN